MEAARRLLGVLKRMAPGPRSEMVDLVEQACGRPDIQPHERERFDFLTWRQISDMAAAGVEFGAHTVNHPILSTLPSGDLDRELLDSKQQIEERLGRECYAFAYPNGAPGDFGPREKRALRRLGYR